jgi:hypothetical protein
MIEDIKKIIELSPARQAQVCYDVTFKKEPNRLKVRFNPNLNHFLMERIGDRNTLALYSSTIFHVGLTVGVIEHWCQENNKRYKINVDIPPDQESNLSPNFLELLCINRNFIIDETVSYLEYLNENKRIVNNQIYEYDSNKCQRDLMFLLDAIIFDIKYDTNQRICHIMSEFWIGGQRQVRGVAEKFAYNFLKDLIINVITKNQEAVSYQKIKKSSQKILDKTIEPIGIEKFLTLFDNFVRVVEEGLHHVPIVYNAFPRNKDTIEVLIYE